MYVQQTVNQREGEQKDKLKGCKLEGRNLLETSAYFKYNILKLEKGRNRKIAK